MPKYNPENERVKRAYFAHLRAARGLSETSIDAVAKAIHRFELSTGFRSFKKFHIEQAMASRDTLSHDVARSFHDRLKGGGYRARTAAENVGAGYHTLAQAFSGWRDSPPHRANMLLKGATRMGIAAVYAPKSKYKVFWALILAEPDERRG